MDKESRHDTDELEEPDELPPVPVGIAPDGLPQPLQLPPPPPVPDRTPGNFVCLRGPCRYYWRLETMANEGNPQGTFDTIKRQIHHTCLVNPGYETSFADDNAFACNLWDPISPDQLVERARRREDYFQRHPEHRENEDARQEDTDTDDKSR